MPTLTLPKIGKTGSNATVLRWRKQPGDALRKGEIVVEVETDEGYGAVESPLEGVLKERLTTEGSTLPIGAPIAVIHESSSAPSEAPVQPEKSSKPTMNSPSGTVTPILMPKAGQSMEEGVIVKWHVQPGAVIKKGTLLFEIETDKATMEIEATDAGRLARIVVSDGGSSPVLVPVAYLADNDADVDAFIAASGSSGAPASTVSASAVSDEKEISSPALTASTTSSSGRVKASPAARKVAQTRGVDLASVSVGSGPGGRILSSDIPVGGATRQPVSAPPPQSGAEMSADVTRKRMSGMRKAIARNLTLSKTTIPHWYIRARINAGPMMTFYKSQKAKCGCSVNDVIVMACAKAIMEFPAMRSRVDGETVLEYPGAHIGVAVGMDDGLVVPVVMNAERLTLAETAAETKRLANQARAGKIENMGQGIFTISNLGMFGVDDFIAIVNPPEASILAVSAVREDVIVKDGAIKAGQVLNLTLSADHRLIDGTLGAQFMARLKALLEEPLQLIA